MIITHTACVEQPLTATAEETVISISLDQGIQQDTRAEKPGDYPDNVVRNLRVLAFNSNGTLYNNVRYDIINSALDAVRHPIKVGTYDFVFLANVPDNIETTLTNGINNLTDLNSILYSESAFKSDELIPMMQKITNVEVNADGKVILRDGMVDIHGNQKTPASDTPISLVVLKLDRLGIRLEVILKSTLDLTSSFTGIVLSNIPDNVPLFASSYSGMITRTTERKFTLADDASYFSDYTLPQEDKDKGFVWATKINRIILPSNNLKEADKKDKTKAVILTVNVENKYNPATELEIIENSHFYSLPYNSWLELEGIVKEPLELNIKAQDWDKTIENWDIAGNRILNVSQTEVSITDYNGARISFYSNMPVVKVLPTLKTGGDTNTVFNDLAYPTKNETEGTYSTTRFFYNPATGEGYMDILVDGGLNPGNATGTYELTLSAESADGTRVLQRDITIEVSQYGVRHGFNTWGGGYVGAFYRNEEKGERIITGQFDLEEKWWVKVDEPYESFVTLSSTPSFDPFAGTNALADPEKYPVIPNSQRGEDGTLVEGRGRIYFRIGLEEKNTTGKPQYATITIHYDLGWGDINQTFYIRQGEDDDYLMRPIEEDRIVNDDSGGQLKGQLRTAAKEFSAFNLTAPGYINGGTDFNPKLQPKGGVSVEYPTQAGAFFQWGVNYDGDHNADYNADWNKLRMAFHPRNPRPWEGGWPGYWHNNVFGYDPIWNPSTGTNFSELFEVCPEGYHRPTDGHTGKMAYNGLYPHFRNIAKAEVDYLGNVINAGDIQNYRDEISESEWRVSLYIIPKTDNRHAGWDVDPETNPDAIETYSNYDKTTIPSANGAANSPINLVYGFYADGYFDRLPSSDIGAVGLGDDLMGVGVAYRGVLFYNPNSKASLFFPAAGRRYYSDGVLQYPGETGYYWSSSVAPAVPVTPTGGVWGIELNRDNSGPISSIHTFGHSIRCVAD